MFEQNLVQIYTSSAAPLHLPLDTDRSNHILTEEDAEEIGVDRTMTDKSTDVQDSTKDAK